MLRFKIHFDYKVSPALYEDYSRFIYRAVKRKIAQNINPLKYKIREPYILESSLIQWIGDPPEYIDLTYYINNCLEMRRERGEYVIQLNESLRIPGTYTKVSTLVRMLEYGTNKLPALPNIRRVMLYYSIVYQFQIIEYMKERLLK